MSAEHPDRAPGGEAEPTRPEETVSEETAEMPGTAASGPPGGTGDDGGGGGDGGGGEGDDGGPPEAAAGRPRWLWPAVLVGVAAVVIAALALFALDGDGERDGDAPDEPAPTTATSAPASTEPEEPGTSAPSSTTATATTAPDTTEPSGTDLEDGRHAVYLVEVDVQGRTVEFDVIQFLGGQEAEDAYYRENPDAPPGGPPNDFYIVNENPRLRRLPVTGDVEVTVLDWENSYAPRSIPFDGLASHVDNSPVPREDDGTWPIPVWLTVDDGRITEVEEQFIP